MSEIRIIEPNKPNRFQKNQEVYDYLNFPKAFLCSFCFLGIYVAVYSA